MYKYYIILGRIVSNLISPISKPLLKRTNRVYAMIVVNGEVLMVKNWLGKNEWRLPGGGVRRSEKPSIALQRELHEELKLSFTEDMFQVIDPIVVKDKVGFSYHCYKIVLDTKPEVSRSWHEIVDVSWVSADQAKTELSNRDRALGDYLLQ